MTDAKSLRYSEAPEDALGSLLVGTYIPANALSGVEIEHLFIYRTPTSFSVTHKTRIIGENMKSKKTYRRWRRTVFLNFKTDDQGTLTIHGSSPNRMSGKYGNLNRHFQGFIYSSVSQFGEATMDSLVASELTKLYSRNGKDRKFTSGGSLAKEIAEAVYPGRAPLPINDQAFRWEDFKTAYPKALTRYFRDSDFHANLFTKDETALAAKLIPKFMDGTTFTTGEYLDTVWFLHLTRRLLSTEERESGLATLARNSKVGDGEELWSTKKDPAPSFTLDGPDFRAFLKRFPADQRYAALDAFIPASNSDAPKLTEKFNAWLFSASGVTGPNGHHTSNRSNKTALALVPAPTSPKEAYEAVDSILNGEGNAVTAEGYGAYKTLTEKYAPKGLDWITWSVQRATFDSPTTKNTRFGYRGYTVGSAESYRPDAFSKAWKEARALRMQQSATNYFRWEAQVYPDGTVPDTPGGILRVAEYAEAEARRALTKHGIPVTDDTVAGLLQFADKHAAAKTGTRNPLGLRWFKLYKLGYSASQIQQLEKWRVSLKTAEDMKDAPWEWLTATFSKNVTDDDDFGDLF